MVASSLEQTSKTQKPKALGALGYDFALLGLNARESRVEVIRKAAESTAARIHDASIELSEHDSMLSDLAASTYRLLDPRKRRKVMERVQLSIYSEADMDLQKRANQALLPEQDGAVAGANACSKTCTETTGAARKISASPAPRVRPESSEQGGLRRGGVHRSVKPSGFGGRRYGVVAFQALAALCGLLTALVIALS